MKNGKHEAPNAVIILSPYDALNVYSLIEKCEEINGRLIAISPDILESLNNYKEQIKNNLSSLQIEDATAEQCAKNLIAQTLNNN